jgi:hypothetical protein
MTYVTDGLPDKFCRVKCVFKSHPHQKAHGYYWFNPINKTFRTKKGKDKTSRVLQWEIA